MSSSRSLFNSLSSDEEELSDDDDNDEEAQSQHAAAAAAADDDDDDWGGILVFTCCCGCQARSTRSDQHAQLFEHLLQSAQQNVNQKLQNYVGSSAMRSADRPAH